MVTDRVEVIIAALEELKAREISICPVAELSSWFDTMIIAGATSNRHAVALAEKTMAQLKDMGMKVQGVEGLETGEWILLDTGSVIVHIMLPAVRQLYSLEQLWQVDFASAKQTTNEN